jgi:hypothetical protein
MRRVLVAATHCVAAVLLARPAQLAAQPPAMSGIARYAASGKPMECLHVALADSLGRTVAHTVTDAAGTFVVVAPDTGAFRVRFIVAGYEPMQGPLLHLTAGLMTEQEYPLSFDELIAGELEIPRFPNRQPSVDLGEWRSASPRGQPLGIRGMRPMHSGSLAQISATAVDLARVAAELIIDANGQPRASSWRTIASTSTAMVQNARRQYLAHRYEPAHIGEQPVCELQFVEVKYFRGQSAARFP